MTKLIRFLDDEHKGHRANIQMDNGDPCLVSIIQTGILVKRSKLGLFGAKLYEEKNMNKTAKIAKILSGQYRDDLTPGDMREPVLKSVVNAVLHCSSLAEVTRILNKADLKAESQAKDADIITSVFFKNSLMAIAEHLRKISGTPESENLEDAVTLVLAHIISYVQGKKISHFPIEGHVRDSEVLISIVFIYFVANQLISHLRDEGDALPVNNIIKNAASTVFSFLDTEKVTRIAHAGMEQYKATVKSGETRKNIRDYTHTVGNSVLAYVMSRDERLLEVFSALFLTLVDAQEN